ncbi:predicted protein [Histoplasma capsulatum var. duboisii H88]|uniref:Predicted protein n=2 Tax=Ajellomyces capsulatus TaxID=5037 RepID=F0UBN6_AJEC8|nr:predicted protein [Histoplasma capsulatum H143]EGC43092.1 predicted protein [Histoplasma capsulatum var. duboisii H88]
MPATSELPGLCVSQIEGSNREKCMHPDLFRSTERLYCRTCGETPEFGGKGGWFLPQEAHCTGAPEHRICVYGAIQLIDAGSAGPGAERYSVFLMAISKSSSKPDKRHNSHTKQKS